LLPSSCRAYPSDRVEIDYAIIFPAATILNIVIAPVLIAVAKRG
jgi:hypothetical protein